MKEVFAFIMVLVAIGFTAYAVCALLEFVIEVPKQLKRIADAMEWRNKNAKEIVRMNKPTYDEIYKRLGYYENREIRGKWKFVDLDGYWYNECSVCGEKTENHDGSPPDFNYCPYCGAKTDAGENGYVSG